MSRASASLGSHRTEVSVFDYQYQWAISNFKFCCGKKPGDALNSPIFTIDGTQIQGRLKLYPNGINVHRKNYVSIYLELKGDQNSDVIAEFHVWIQKTNATRSSKLVNFSTTKVHGFADFVERDLLLDDNNKILTNGELSIVIDMRVSTGVKKDSVKTFVNRENCSESFEKMLKKKKFCDVTLCIDDQQFQAHKVILAVRSERFNQILSNNPNRDYLIINDIPVEIMKSVLLYLYTGEVYVDGLQLEDFLNVALSYQFMDKELKSKLEDEVMISQINVNNAAELIAVAYDYNLDKLYDNILDFIYDHRTEIVQSEGYKNIVQRRADFFARLGFDQICDLPRNAR